MSWMLTNHLQHTSGPIVSPMHIKKLSMPMGEFVVRLILPYEHPEGINFMIYNKTSVHM